MCVMTWAMVYLDTSYNHKMLNQLDQEKKDLFGRHDLGSSDVLECGRKEMDRKLRILTASVLDLQGNLII